jgi:5-methylcytosine-specific restriction protein A
MPTRPPVHNAGVARSEYEGTRGNARTAQGYTARWRRFSLQYRRAHPLCLGCLAVGDTTATYCTDHVVPHKGDLVLMWHTNNLQPLCKWHHDVIKQQLEQMHLRGEIKSNDLAIDSPIAMKLTREQR